MKKFLIIFFLITTPIANAKSVCEKFFDANNMAFRHKTNMNEVSVEFSLTKQPYSDLKAKKTWDWSNIYSDFTDWQKCNSGDFRQKREYSEYHYIVCNGKTIAKVRKYIGWPSGDSEYTFTWYDSNGNTWYTQDWKPLEKRKSEKYGTYKWISTKCDFRDGYYTDRETTLYHQYNETLDQYWAALVKIRKFYGILKPQF